MIESDVEKLIRVLKLQAEAFLLNAKEFYPFGTYISVEDKIVPVSAYLGNNHPASSEVIDSLEKTFILKMQNGESKISAIAIDIVITENNERYDGVEMRFFEAHKDVYKKYFKYLIKDTFVEFSTHIV